MIMTKNSNGDYVKVEDIKQNYSFQGEIEEEKNIEYIYTQNGDLLYSKYNEVSGVSPLNFRSKSNNNSTLKNYRIYGNTASGESVGDKTGNLFDIDDLVDGALNPYDGKTIIYNEQKHTESYISVSGDSYYTLSGVDNSLRIHQYKSDYTFIKSDVVNNDSNFVTDSQAAYIRLAGAVAEFIQPMLNSGSTALSYEPYGYKVPVTVANGTDTQTTNLYLPEQLKKVNDVYEYIDYAEQKQHFADGTSTAVTLPELDSLAGTNVLTVETEVQPSDIYLKGKIEKKPKIYYYSDDRQTLLYTESVLKGENGTYSNPPEKTNYIFLGWYPKAININKNQNCYSVFVEQNENEAILVMYAINGLYNNKNSIDFVFKRSVPADKYDIVKIGIHYGTNKLAGADTTISGYDKVDLTVNGAAYGVNDVETVLRTGGGKVKNAVATYTGHSGKFALSYALGNNVDSYALAVGYIQAIEKATGNEVTFYSNLISTTYNKCSQLYTVIFYNDATLLKTSKVVYGDNIIYSGATPTKASTQQYEYNFLGWNTDSSASTADANALANITSNKTVYAIFAQTVKRYTVTFYKEQSAIGIGMVNYGDNAIYSGETPTKASTQQYDYNFLGWSTDPSATIADANALSNITADRTVYAIFAQTTRTYTVTFYNESTVLETVYNVPYGGTATYTGSTPTKTDYEFTGWLPQPTNITANTSCYAQFEEAIAYITDSWETISQRGIAGTAQNYYSVGDTKPIKLQGTMGTLALDETLYVYILGFNHNTAYEPSGITFGGFKTAAKDGIDIALCDSYYTSNNTTGLKWFNMNHRQGSIQYGHNYGGWKGSDMRYDILGSTDTAPSGYGAQAITSNVGYDASSTCATSPVANTLMSCLPSDLRAVMKPMTKYTDNVGNSSNTSGNVTASIDYLPLLAEYEIFGARSYANQYEQNKQAQYAYYADGNNNKVKYRHSSTGSTARWWERSPFYNNSYNFCDVDNNGSAVKYAARQSYGVAPIFLVGTAPTYYTVTYYSQDGQTVLSTEQVEQNHNCAYSTAPTKESDTDFDYTFAGWSTTTNSTTATANATTNIQQNTNLYAAFSKALKGDTISDSWEEIIANCDNGTYASKYQIGDLKTIDVGTEGPVQMQIVAIDTDLLASDNTKKAPITWISKQLLNTYKAMHSTSSNYLSDWANCDMRTYLRGTILPMLPSVVQNGIKEVTKYTCKRISSTVWTTVSATENIWLPSYREVSNDTSCCETSGVQYNSIFTNSASRVKSKIGNSAYYWWIRSASGGSRSSYSYYFAGVYSSGGANDIGSSCTDPRGVAIGFCT